MLPVAPVPQASTALLISPLLLPMPSSAPRLYLRFHPVPLSYQSELNKQTDKLHHFRVTTVPWALLWPCHVPQDNISPAQAQRSASRAAQASTVRSPLQETPHHVPLTLIAQQVCSRDTHNINNTNTFHTWCSAQFDLQQYRRKSKGILFIVSKTKYLEYYVSLTFFHYCKKQKQSNRENLIYGISSNVSIYLSECDLSIF